MRENKRATFIAGRKTGDELREELIVGRWGETMEMGRRHP
jgi:hypothetical protein